MNKVNSKESKIRQIGPLFEIEGGIMFLSPFKTKALIGYEETKALKTEEPFLQFFTKESERWFDKFPDCCDIHQELKQIPAFNKEEFAFIPGQIINNLKYFTYALEKFIDTENGFQEILDYTDYLLESFGQPGIGEHIFKQALKMLIESVKLDDKDLTDEMRLNLLLHLEPKTPSSDLDQRDLGVLYLSFQKWLNAMPSIGGFKELKEKFMGKIPMDIFIMESKFNRYLGCSSYRMRSREDLLMFLLNMTNEILSLSRNEVKKENYDMDKMVIVAEERLRIQQEKLFEKGHSNLELSYFELVETWLSNVIDFYKVLNIYSREIQSAELLGNVKEVLSKIDDLQIEIAALCNSDKILNWLKIYLRKESSKELLNEIERLDDSDKESGAFLDWIVSQLKTKSSEDFNIENVEKKVKSSDVSIKHKIKLTIPLFLFTSYEAEMELSDKQKLPKSLKELKDLFIEQ